MKKCYYCERGLTDSGATTKTKDHIIPKTFGGINATINYVDCCKVCNQLKGHKSLPQFENFIQKKINKDAGFHGYSYFDLLKIKRNTRSLIDNCLMVYGRNLFDNKHSYESYLERFLTGYAIPK